MTDEVVIDTKGSAVVIRFNRPAKRNPLSSTLLKNLGTTLKPFLPRPDLNAIIFTGTGDVFASGADLQELSQLDNQSASEFSKLGQELFQLIADARQLTIAAIDGFCIGGALDLALACDIRFASSSAVFAHPGARLGIITGWGGTQRLPRIIGRHGHWNSSLLPVG
ncbi:MAG: enoyl-CoA hydratase/isomerase family protein [Pyrinomonadaceae bacterium]